MTATTMPTALPVIPENIPAELRACRQWVCWRWKLRNGKWTKPPYQTNGELAKSNTRATWNTFEAVLLAQRSGQFSGVGYVLTKDDPFTVIDLDDAYDQTTGAEEWASDLLEDWSSYLEVSPSGTGLRAIGRGKKPGEHCGPKKYGTGKVELYDYTSTKYLTFTGRVLPESATETEDAQDRIERIYQTVFPPDGEPGPKPSRNGAGSNDAHAKLPDEDLLRLARRADNGTKFSALYDHGDLSGHGDDQSRADAALCAILAFWCHGDVARIDRLFRGSKLFREKWDEKRSKGTYGSRTIDKEVSRCREFYSPGPTAVINPQSATGADSKPAAEGPQSGREGYTIILEHFRQVYRPAFRRGTSLYSSALGRDVKIGEATAGAGKKLIDGLAMATNAPRTKDGSVSYNHLPQFFNAWCRSAWVDLLNSLPDEEDTPDADKAAGDEFCRLVRQALLSQVTFSVPIRDRAGNVIDHRPERRSLIDWCAAWANPEQENWEPVRSYRCWFRRDVRPDGEIVLRVAIRHELFGQVAGTDRRLVEMTTAAFSKKARLYGVGSAGDGERPQGRRAVVLDTAFVESLTACPDPAEEQKER